MTIYGKLFGTLRPILEVDEKNYRKSINQLKLGFHYFSFLSNNDAFSFDFIAHWNFIFNQMTYKCKTHRNNANKLCIQICNEKQHCDACNYFNLQAKIFIFLSTEFEMQTFYIKYNKIKCLFQQPSKVGCLPFQLRRRRTFYLSQLSRGLKQAFLIEICPLCVLVIVNFSHTASSSPEPLVQVQPNWHKALWGEGNSSLIRWKATLFSNAATLGVHKNNAVVNVKKL